MNYEEKFRVKPGSRVSPPYLDNVEREKPTR